MKAQVNKNRLRWGVTFELQVCRKFTPRSLKHTFSDVMPSAPTTTPKLWGRNVLNRRSATVCCWHQNVGLCKCTRPFGAAEPLHPKPKRAEVPLGPSSCPPVYGGWKLTAPSHVDKPLKRPSTLCVCECRRWFVCCVKLTTLLLLSTNTRISTVLHILRLELQLDRVSNNWHISVTLS